MAFDLQNFVDSLGAGIKAGDLLALVPQSLWHQNPEEAAIKALRRLGLYDESKYLDMYQDVRKSGMGAFEHFVRYGINEQRILPLLRNDEEASPIINERAQSKRCTIRKLEINVDSRHGTRIDKPKSREDYYNELRLPGKDLDAKLFNIGFLAGGGMGDFLIFFNYLYYFCEMFKNESIHIETIYAPSRKFAELFLVEGDLSDAILDHPETSSYFRNYDLFIQLSRYPEIKIVNWHKLKLYSPMLLDYVHKCREFNIKHPRFFDGTQCDGQSAALSELHGIKRIQQPDIYGLLGIKEEYAYQLPVDVNDLRYIHSIKLSTDEYIVLHRGCDDRFQKSTKFWPLDYYNSLIAMLKKEWPNKKIVQIGATHARSGAMDGVDCNLVESMSMLQVAQLLKHATLLIDNEGGMVHLRHALNAGPSVVMFGPTNANFFGYSENYNIRGLGCPHWCEWMTDTWPTICMRGYDESPCMLSIVPDMVMAQVRKALQSGG